MKPEQIEASGPVADRDQRNELATSLPATGATESEQFKVEFERFRLRYPSLFMAISVSDLELICGYWYVQGASDTLTNTREIINRTFSARKES